MKFFCRFATAFAPHHLNQSVVDAAAVVVDIVVDDAAAVFDVAIVIVEIVGGASAVNVVDVPVVDDVRRSPI